MDSLTQITLGATMAEAAMGRKAGNKALLWGAICGTLPDLDVFIPFSGAVEDFTYHRGFSHSVLVLTAIAPVIAWGITRIHPSTSLHWRGWLLAVFLALVTHPLLDSFTVYGTQILWPVEYPVSWSTIFIIDPLYTLPMLLGCLAALLMSRARPRGHRLAMIGLGLSTAYLGWTVFAKFEVERVARISLAAQGIESERLLTTPAPFTSFLWRIVAMGGDGYFEGYYSLFDPEPEVAFTSHQSRAELLAGLEEHWPVARLKWFTHGFYSVTSESPDVVVTDLRMGAEGAYTFAFKVGMHEDGVTRPVPNERAVLPTDFSRLGSVWSRIWDSSVSLAAPE